MQGIEPGFTIFKTRTVLVPTVLSLRSYHLNFLFFFLSKNLFFFPEVLWKGRVVIKKNGNIQKSGESHSV